MPEELAERVILVIAKTQKIPQENITLDSTFQELNIDSLDGLQLVFALEEEFNVSIPDEAAQTMRSVREAVDALDKLISSGAGATA